MRLFNLLLLFFGILLVAACGTPEPPKPVDLGLAIALSDGEKQILLTLSPLPPPPPDPTNRYADDPKAAHFGQSLFFDPRLSINGEVSCATCHNQQKGWSDGLPVAKTLAEGGRNTPTVLNNAYNRWFFWDGRADSLWAQAIQPFENPIEMGMTRLGLLHLFHQHNDLKEAYETIFGKLPDTSDPNRFPKEGRPLPDDPEHPHHQAWASMSPDDQEAVNRFLSHIGKAIAAFERKLISKDSPFDAFIEGLRKEDPERTKALDASAQRGAKLFITKAGCTFCHFGPNFTNGEFHNIGLPLLQGKLPDIGRFDGIKAVLADPFNGFGIFSDDRSPQANQALSFLKPPPINPLQSPDDLGAFKTPSLRDIAQTAPYMRDGRFADLRAVIDFYNELPDKPPIGHREESLQPLNLTEEEKNDLIAFLRALSGKPLPTALTQAPKTPLP